MENNNISHINYDYYSNTSSYIKMILDMLPESRVSQEKKQVIKELYNYFLNRFDDEKIKEIAKVSALFREKISVSSLEEIVKFVDFVCENYLNKIVFDSVNREVIFDVMNDSVKVYVDYFPQYQKRNLSSFSTIREQNYIR